MNRSANTLERFLETCRKTGLRATHQRAEIFQELAQTDEHPDVETLYRRVRRRLPTMSLDTVYRTLGLLEKKGVISRINSLRDRSRFDANADPHNHFICRTCGTVKDVHGKGLRGLHVPPEAAALGTVEHIQIELRGICTSCRAGGR